MKKLLISMLAVATLASCAKEETLSFDKGEAIQFGSFVENSTRADDPSYSANDIDSLKVYGTVNGVNIYNGNKVSRDGKDYGDVWTCTGTQQYWIAGAQYKFVGIVDGDKAGVTETTVVNGMPTAIKYTADGKTDLLCQTIDRTAMTDGTDNAIVAFNFTHLLSKVNFTVVNGSKDATGYSFVVKSITFKGATEATYDVVNAKWNDATATGNTVLGNECTVNSLPVKGIEVATGAASDELDTEVLFIPGTYTISFTVDILYNGELVTTNNYPVTGKTYTHTLAAANAYNFKVNVSVGKPIQFTVTAQPGWTDGDGTGDTTLTL